MTHNLDAKDIAVLEARARKYAATEKNEDRVIDDTVVIVAAGSERFGVPIDNISRIMITPPLARLPQSPPWIAGLAQLRGEMICAVDLARWLQISTNASLTYLVIMESSSGKLGLLVERILEVETVFQDQISQNLVSCGQRQGHPLRATTDNLVTILDAKRLFDSPMIRIGQQNATIESNNESPGNAQ